MILFLLNLSLQMLISQMFLQKINHQRHFWNTKQLCWIIWGLRRSWRKRKGVEIGLCPSYFSKNWYKFDESLQRDYWIFLRENTWLYGYCTYLYAYEIWCLYSNYKVPNLLWEVRIVLYVYRWTDDVVRQNLEGNLICLSRWKSTENLLFVACWVVCCSQSSGMTIDGILIVWAQVKVVV